MAGWLLKRRWLRILLMVTTFPVPFTNLLSGAVLALTARTAGPRDAAMDALASLVLLGGLLRFASPGSEWRLPLVVAAGFWTGCLVGAALWRRYGSLNLPLQVLVLLAWCAVLLAAVLLPDATTVWLPLLKSVVAEALPEGAPPVAGLEMLARFMTGLLAGSLLVSILLALLIGEWLASPGTGAVGAEFATLRMGRVISVAATAGLIAGVAGATTVGGGLVVVALVAFGIQGLAVVHWTARRRRWPAAWPLAVYLPLVLAPPLAGIELLVLALLGLVDNAYSLRPGLRPGDRDVIK